MKTLLPAEYRRTKVNLFANEAPEELVTIRIQQESLDAGKRMLRIDDRTYVLVRAELCTPEYAVKLRQKYEKNRKRLY